MSARVRPRMLIIGCLAMLLVASGCRRAADDTDPTPEPDETPSVVSVSDFQLVGTVDHAFIGAIAPIDLTAPGPRPLTEATPTPTPDAPEATPVGRAAERGGILRVVIEDATDPLSEECGVEVGQAVEVYWTTQTHFAPPEVVEDVETRIDGRTAGISGQIYRGEVRDPAAPTPAPFQTDETPAGTPAVTPAVTPGALAETDCVLVAEQIGLGETTLPTPRPAPRTPAPAPPATPTPEPEETPEPTPTPEGTPQPVTPTPEVTPEDPADPGP